MCQTLGVFSWVRDHFHDEKSTFSNLTNPDFDVWEIFRTSKSENFLYQMDVWNAKLSLLVC